MSVWESVVCMVVRFRSNSFFFPPWLLLWLLLLWLWGECGLYGGAVPFIFFCFFSASVAVVVAVAVAVFFVCFFPHPLCEVLFIIN